MQFVQVAPTGTEQARRAIELSLRDFEDALQVAAAEAFGASVIITRNLAHYRRAPIPALSPTEFIEQYLGSDD